jgi:uncharacterized protein
MKMLRLLPIAVVGTILACSPASAEKIATMPAPTGYIDDYAGVLSQPAKTELEDLCIEVHSKTKAQVFFVTIKTLEGETVETFANQLFHNWKIGEKKTDRGILLLLAIDDHKRWIEVGYGFEGILNDAKVGDIGREMVPSLKTSNYDEAARIGVRDVAKAIAADAGVALAGLSDAPEPATDAANLNDAPPPAPTAIGQSSESPAGKWVLFLFPVVFFLAIALIVVQGIRKGLSGGGSGGAGGDSGGSSFGGGSSSSSDSFSGGDGGDSGGGGAGGDW